ncbi:MAG TPA: hypothetical protein VN690_03715 [Terriglobales bacterium]|nr:hypothetical protein [Terriglobales bacterium]
MEHLDARAIRERLNTIGMALTMLELGNGEARQETAQAAQHALQEIAVLVTDDEMEENGAVPGARLMERRRRIRRAS